MFYIHDEIERKFMYTETVNLYRIVFRHAEKYQQPRTLKDSIRLNPECFLGRRECGCVFNT